VRADRDLRAFAIRLQQSEDLHPECPPEGPRRRAWLIRQLEQQGVAVSDREFGEWMMGDSQPEPEVSRALAQILEVDAAWLTTGA